MKHWAETRVVLDRLARLIGEGRRAAIATVIRVRGSAYRREGAKLLVADDGSTTGNVSGGCLEQDVREVALQVIASGRPQVRRYCSSSDEIAAWDLGLGCDGEIELLVEPAARPRDRERALLAARRAYAVCTVLPASTDAAPSPPARLVVSGDEADGDLGTPGFTARVGARARALLPDGRSGIEHVDGRAVFVETLVPPPRVILFGAGDDACPLARQATEVGFRVVVVDKRPAYLTAERFPTAELIDSRAGDVVQRLALDRETFAVVMTHSFADDQGFVRLLLGSAVPYIGVLGPRQRTERLLVGLAREGPVSAAQGNRVFGPIGLDLGTDGAEQVGLSVLAEILAVRSGRSAGSLRDRETSIHAAG